jgi:photosystem II stability/assembly factor-like uncharacterized protein
MVTPLPEQLGSPIFALTVSPDHPEVVLAGTPTGSIYRSNDAGSSWKLVLALPGRPILTLGFDPFDSTHVLAGTQAGLWRSTDSGKTWARQLGIGEFAARALGFAKSMDVAGTDGGIFVNRTGRTWVRAGLADVHVGALAVAAVNAPARVVAGGDAAVQDGLPLYQSRDDGDTWRPLRNPAAASNVVATLAAGAVLPRGDARPVLMGTNSGAFLSTDNAQTWSALGVPATDITSAAFVADRSDRFYLASDGGGSGRGGLWYSGDSGGTFHDLKPPLPEVTALAVSTETKPTLYIATFRPIDHMVMLWSYHDAGGAPQGPPGGVPAPLHAKASAAPAAVAQAAAGPLDLTATEIPYALLGIAAMFTLVMALFAYLLRGRPRRF